MSIFTIPREPTGLEKFAQAASKGLEKSLPELFKDLEKQKQMGQLESLFGGGQPQQEAGATGEGGQPTASPEDVRQANTSRIKKITDDPVTLTKFGAAFGENAKRSLLEQRKVIASEEKSERQFGQAERKQSFTENKAYLEFLSENENSLPGQEIAMEQINDSLKSNNLKTFKNFAAEYFKNPEFIKSSDAVVLNSAIKSFLLGDIAKIKGGRPNQFIERQLVQAYPLVGADPIANEKIKEAMQTGLDIKRKEIELAGEKRDVFDSQGKPLPSNFERQVKKELKGFVAEKEKELEQKYKTLNKPISKVKKGTVLERTSPIARSIYLKAGQDAKKAKRLAEALGYTLGE